MHSSGSQRWALLVTKIKHLQRVLPLKERILFNVLLALFFVSLIGVLVGGYFALTQPAPKSGGSYREAIVGRPRMINPLYSESNAVDRDLVQLMYAGLVRFDGTTIAPDLAHSWEISEDQKTYTFHLYEDITWPDSDIPFTSRDVEFTFQTIQNPAYQSPLLSTFNGIDVHTEGDYVVVFTLPKPYTPFLESLSVGILPEYIWSNIPPESVALTDFNIQPVGLGPFRFAKLRKTKFGTIQSYELDRNSNYHLGQPYIKNITFKFYPDIEQSIAALESNEVDGLSFLPQRFANARLPKSITIHSFQLPQYTALFYNLSSSSEIKNKEVRRALSLAINKQQILDEAVSGMGQIIDGPILEGYPGYNPDIEKFEFDPQQSLVLLSSEGWTKNEEGQLQDKDGTQLALTITTTNTPELSRAAEIIQQSWQELGIQVDLHIVDNKTIQSDVISPRKFDILLFGEIVGLDPDPYPFWHSSQISSQGLNLSNFKNSEADKVLEEARETPDITKKSEKYVHFQNILVASVPATFLYSPYYLYPVTDSVKGIENERIIGPVDRLSNSHLWYIKTKRVFK